MLGTNTSMNNLHSDKRNIIRLQAVRVLLVYFNFNDYCELSLFFDKYAINSSLIFWSKY